MKRHVLTPSRWVSVEDGVVRDLDGNTLGVVTKAGSWLYQPNGSLFIGEAPTQTAAIAALLADPSCPTPGPNRYDR